MLDEGDIALLKTYGMGPYTAAIKQVEKDIRDHQDKLKELIGIKESDTGLSQPSVWDLNSDQQMAKEEQTLLVARCTKVEPRYICFGGVVYVNSRCSGFPHDADY